MTLSGTASAHHPLDARLCSLGSAGVGRAGAVVCRDLRSGATTQSVGVGATVSALRGGLVGGLAMRDGAAQLLAYTRAESDSDFLSLVVQAAVGSAAATGLLVLPPLR